MSMQDPIADMFVRIKNAQAVGKKMVVMPSSNTKQAIAKVLDDEGYIVDYKVSEKGHERILTILLKYHNGAAVIEKLQRISRPGLRIYRNKDELPKVKNGLGVAIISTSKGVVSDHRARKAGIGGEVLCYVC